VVGGGVDLADVEAAQFCFEGVASASAARESGGEYHAVVSQCVVWDALAFNGFAEILWGRWGGHAAVGGDRDRSGRGRR
jgi:hypothetical protein